MNTDRRSLIRSILTLLKNILTPDLGTKLCKELAAMTIPQLQNFLEKSEQAMVQFHQDTLRATQPDYLGELLNDLQAVPIDFTCPLSDLTDLEGHTCSLEEPTREDRSDRRQNHELRSLMKQIEAELQRQEAERERHAHEQARRLTVHREIDLTAMAVYAEK